MTHRATGVGSMPGDSFVESAKFVLGELEDLPFLVELPDRGPHAGMIGRSAALVTGIGIDLQPAGWRLTDASGVDHQRAASLLAHDLDVLEELAQGDVRRLKVQVAGPWTLAASMERPRGGRVLGDHGARRDLAQALAEGVSAHAKDVQRRLSGADVVVQIDEPVLPAVLAGEISTASGLGRHRSVTPSEASEALEWTASALVADGFGVVVHCCAPDLPLAVLRETSAQSVSFDLSAISPGSSASSVSSVSSVSSEPSEPYERLAQWADSGRALWPGAIPALDPAEPAPNASAVTARLISWWGDLGWTDVESIPETTVTPACGLAGASPTWARAALETARTVARNLSVEAGKIEP